MPKVIKKRISKHENPGEGLQDTVDDIRSRLKERQRLLVMGFAAFLVVLIAVGGFVVYNKSQRDKAAELQREAYRLFYNDNSAELAGSGDNYRKALDLFTKSYDIKQKAYVLLYIAYCKYELGNYDDAIKTLKELNDKFPDPGITPLAYYKMAEAYLKKGDSANALTTLKDLASIKDGIFHDIALMESGKILDSQGKKEEAKAMYKELLSKFPNSSLAAEAKTRLGE
ncbi:MAG: tetratricopeptide repeat protein [Dissulfurispiraceae bacterium]|jgi:predicted negative regulator of RcsB-dependent stress response